MKLAHRSVSGGIGPRARRGEAGSVLLIVAISLSVIVTSTALTIDLGRLSSLRRDLQNVADAAALDLVRLVDGRTAGEITSDPRWVATRDASLARNGFVSDTDAVVTARLGAYDADAEVFTPVTAADQIPSAVEVQARDRSDNQFAPGGFTTSRTAVGAQTASAGIQVGSFAARLDSSQSPLLGALLGDALGLTVVGYEGLAGVRLSLPELATELDLSLASPDELLDTELTVLELIEAQVRVLERGGMLAEADVLRTIGLNLENPDAPISLGDLMTIATGGADAAAVATLDVLELLTATAFVANGKESLAIPGLDLGVPGVANVAASVVVTQFPQIAFGGPGTSVRTAQVGLVTEVGLDVLGLAGAKLTLDLDVADATAVIRDLTCGDPSRLDLDVTTGLVQVFTQLSTELVPTLPFPLNTILDPVLRGRPVAAVTLEATAGQGEETTLLPFDLPPDELGVAKQVSTHTLSLTDLDAEGEAEILAGVPVLGPALALLLDGVVDGLVDAVVRPLFQQVLAALDAVLVQPLLSLLGISLPGADVTPLALRCSGAELVA